MAISRSIRQRGTPGRDALESGTASSEGHSSQGLRTRKESKQAEPSSADGSPHEGLCQPHSGLKVRESLPNDASSDHTILSISGCNLCQKLVPDANPQTARCCLHTRKKEQLTKRCGNRTAQSVRSASCVHRANRFRADPATTSSAGPLPASPGFHRETRAPEGSSGSHLSDSTPGTLAGEGMIQPAGANIPKTGVGFTKQMPSNDIYHTAHFT